MSIKTKQEPLTLVGGVELQYRPLPGLDVADYIEEHTGRASATGVFDDLAVSGRGITLDKLDLETLAVLGSALAHLLTGGDEKKSLRTHVIEHCARFQVQAKDGDGWVDLFSDDADAAVDVINKHLEFADMSELVITIAMSVITPLLARLASVAAARQQKSAKLSAEPSTES
ncbi:unnamed protein product [marine sediment metagenome]|uniref:Tail assembly chaperone n=1 Tax=marine sediment metagenome TaxID=412755 RepID=X0RR41_9ZZZZ